MVKLENLNLKLGKFSLQNINLTIKEGELHAILGPSGAGKSSLINAVLGISDINSGKILIEGKDYTKMAAQKRGFGYVPQNLALFPHLSVKENILFGLKVKGKKPDAFFEKLAEKAGIKELLDRKPQSLSGGQKQRVALIRALVVKPKLLLLDEPFSALDITLKRQMWELLLDLQKEFNITALFITHDLDEARFLSNRASVLIEGKIEQSSKTKELFEKPKNVKVARYLGYKNIFKGKAVSKNSIYIDEMQANLETKESLDMGKSYTVLIKQSAIKFEKEEKEGSFKVEPKIFELNSYNLIIFKIGSATFETAADKQRELTKFVSFKKDEILFLN